MITLQQPHLTTASDDERGSGRFTHLVTLSNRKTGEEACMVVVTETDRFADVLAAIKIQRVLHGLTSFGFVEALPMEAPF